MDKEEVSHTQTDRANTIDLMHIYSHTIGKIEMTITHGFDHELPSGQACYVEADIEPLIPAYTNCLPEDAYPAQGGTAEITSVTITGEGPEGTTVTILVDLEDMWIRRKSSLNPLQYAFSHYLEDLADIAYDNWGSSQ